MPQDSRLTYRDLFDLQVWTKHSGKPGYRKEAKLYLPGKTLEEIEQHEDWHQELIYLQDRKREVEKCVKTCMSPIKSKAYLHRYMVNTTVTITCNIPH